MGGREGRREDGTQGGEEKGTHVRWEEQKAPSLSGQRFIQGSGPALTIQRLEKRLHRRGPRRKVVTPFPENFA